MINSYVIAQTIGFLENKTKNSASTFGVKVIYEVWDRKSNMNPENQDCS